MDIREIAVNTVTLQNDINDMRGALDKVKKRTETMRQEVIALNSMWEGEAHDAFLQQFLLDCQKMQELQGAAEKLIESVQYADKEYISCEDKVHSIIGSIRI